jgi:hypothetical protein
LWPGDQRLPMRALRCRSAGHRSARFHDRAPPLDCCYPHPLSVRQARVYPFRV